MSSGLERQTRKHVSSCKVSSSLLLDNPFQLIAANVGKLTKLVLFSAEYGNSVDEAVRQYELIRSGIPPPGPIKNLPAIGNVRIQSKPEVNGSRSSPNSSHRNDSSNIRVILPRNSEGAKQSSPQVSNKGSLCTAVYVIADVF